MKHPELWRPSKFVPHRGGWRASRDPVEVGLGTRLTGDRVARVYHRVIEAHARGRLLDLGCGKVPLYGMYRDRVDEVVCVDWPETPHPSPHLDHQLDLNRELPLPDSAHDTILLTDVLEHIARPDVLWREMARLLAPAGRLIVTVPFLYWIHEAPHDHFRYTEHRLRLYCDDHGLELLELEPYGGSPEVLADLLAKHLGFSRVLSAVHSACARALLALPPVRALSRKTARKLPLGYWLVAGKAG